MSAPCVINPGTRQGVFDDYSAWTADSAKAMSTGNVCFFDPDLPLQRNTLFAAVYTDVTGDQPTWTRTISLQIDGTKPIALDLYAYAADRSIYGTEIKPYVAFSSATDFSKAFTWQSACYLQPGLNRVVIPPSEWINVGGESWSNTMVRMRFGFPAFSGRSYYQYVSGVRLMTGVQTQPAALIMSADTKLSFYLNGLPLMDARGIKGTFISETNDITYPGDMYAGPDGARYWHMSADQVKDIQARGWTIVGDMDPSLYIGDEVTEYNILPWPSWAYAALRQTSTDWLTEHGIVPDPRFVAPEGGIVPGRLVQVLGKDGVSAILSLSASWRTSVPLFGIAPYLIPSGLTLSSSVTLAQIKAEVDKAKEAGQTIVIKVCNIDRAETGIPNWSSADFAALLDYIQAQGIPTMTLAEWYSFATGVTGPDVTVAFSGAELPLSADVEMSAGEAKVLRFSLPGAWDLDGSTVAYRLAASERGPSLLSKGMGGAGITIVDGPSRIFEVTLADSDTATLAPGRYIHEVVLTRPDGASVVAARGVLFLEGRLT